MNIEKMHTIKTDVRTKIYVKDIFISSSFEILAIDWGGHTNE